jgi:leucyl-tRNA synthetase
MSQALIVACSPIDSQRRSLTAGKAAFNRTLPFPELHALQLLKPYIKQSLKFEDLNIVSAEDAQARINANGESQGWTRTRIEAAEPGSPSLELWNV